MSNAVYTIQLTRCESLFTTIHVHKSGHGAMEFRGDGMWQWGFNPGVNDPGLDHLRNHGRNICWAEWWHNGLLGMHTCILHAEGGPFCVHDRHDDYLFMTKIWDFAHMKESEVLELSDKELRVESI